ncbi:hypothetical protein HK102_007994 [Quaeritorhiza haematococci]|nr:hypothetical protein HK102_007994 [Quaeritorhiza haematococci]
MEAERDRIQVSLEAVQVSLEAVQDKLKYERESLEKDLQHQREKFNRLLLDTAFVRGCLSGRFIIEQMEAQIRNEREVPNSTIFKTDNGKTKKVEESARLRLWREYLPTNPRFCKELASCFDTDDATNITDKASKVAAHISGMYTILSSQFHGYHQINARLAFHVDKIAKSPDALGLQVEFSRSSDVLGGAGSTEEESLKGADDDK